MPLAALPRLGSGCQAPRDGPRALLPRLHPAPQEKASPEAHRSRPGAHPARPQPVPLQSGLKAGVPGSAFCPPTHAPLPPRPKGRPASRFLFLEPGARACQLRLRRGASAWHCAPWGARGACHLPPKNAPWVPPCCSCVCTLNRRAVEPPGDACTGRHEAPQWLQRPAGPGPDSARPCRLSRCPSLLSGPCPPLQDCRAGWAGRSGTPHPTPPPAPHSRDSRAAARRPSTTTGWLHWMAALITRGAGGYQLGADSSSSPSSFPGSSRFSGIPPGLLATLPTHFTLKIQTPRPSSAPPTPLPSALTSVGRVTGSPPPRQSVPRPQPLVPKPVLQAAVQPHTQPTSPLTIPLLPLIALAGGGVGF